MYINSTYKQINENTPTKEYKKALKLISTINLRRSSKFTIIALYGALKCLENMNFNKNIALYIATEYGCIEDMIKVLTQVNIEGEIVMPFDFLNVNTNNVGFFISKALETIGKNINITSEDLSFEKAFELAYFDINIQETQEALIGGVDESLENIRNSNELIFNPENKKSKDGTSWIYLSKNSDNALAKVEDIITFENIEKLNSKLESIQYDKVSLNLYATKYQEELKIDKNLILKQKDEFYGTYSAGYIINLLEYQNTLIHISLDSKKRAYLFLFSKV